MIDSPYIQHNPYSEEMSLKADHELITIISQPPREYSETYLEAARDELGWRETPIFEFDIEEETQPKQRKLAKESIGSRQFMVILEYALLIVGCILCLSPFSIILGFPILIFGTLLSAKAPTPFNLRKLWFWAPILLWGIGLFAFLMESLLETL